MIRIEKLNLRIKKTDILSDICMELESGRIHGLVGRNGSGKTMLMKCICGFVYPTDGTVQIDGKYVGKDMDFPESLGVIIETPEFIPYMSGYDNLKILAAGRKRITPGQIRQVMKMVELDPDSRLHVRKYSMGMKQRLGIAQAVMEEPELLVLDEPFNGLDEDGVKLVRKIMLKKRDQGTTILLSSHNSEDIDLLCDTVHRLRKGRIVDSIKPAKG